MISLNRTVNRLLIVVYLSISPFLGANGAASRDQPKKNVTIAAIGPTAKLIDEHNYLGSRIAVSCSETTTCRLADFIRDTRVCALFVIVNHEVRLKLFNGDTSVCAEDGPNTFEKRYGLASVTKSLTSTWVGSALAQRYKLETEGQLKAALQHPIRDFLPGNDRRALAGGYADVRLEQLLQMRSGIAWRENSWPRFLSDSVLFDTTVRERPSKETIVQFAAHYKRGVGQPTFNYKALDAAVAAVVASDMAADRSYRAFQNGVWKMIGAANAASWNVDTDLVPIGPCCFSATVDDLARFGDFVLDKGNNVVPRAWFDLATRSPPQTTPRPKHANVSCELDYGYFWWLRRGRSDFTAFGRDGQFVHIYPEANAVIVQIAD